WRIRHNRRVPSPENCVGLELATAKQVSQWRTNGMPKPWKLFFRTKSPKVFRAWELSVGETATASPLGVGHA
ncbi:hypothetical protein WLV05_23895, partial [Bordetella bronchiseptica]